MSFHRISIFQRILRIGLSILFFSGPCLLNPAFAEPLTVGDKAPSLAGKNAAGKGILKLQSLTREVGYQKDETGRFKEKKGKYVLEIKHNVVVLNFFSTTCIPCLKEIPAYNRVADRFRNNSVRLIYVNVEAGVTPRKIRRFIARKRIRVPMMMPNQREAIKKYDVISLPRIVIIDSKGRISHILKGYSENLESLLIRRIEALMTVSRQ